MTERRPPPLPPDVEEFLAFLRDERRASPHTLRAYRKDLEQFLEYLSEYQGKTDLYAVVRQDIRGFIALQTRLGYSKRTIQRRLSSIRGYFRYIGRMEQVFPKPQNYKEIEPVVLQTSPDIQGFIEFLRDKVKVNENDIAQYVKDLVIFFQFLESSLDGKKLEYLNFTDLEKFEKMLHTLTTSYQVIDRRVSIVKRLIKYIRWIHNTGGTYFCKEFDHDSPKIKKILETYQNTFPRAE